MDVQVGSGNWVCDSYSTGLFVPSAGVYAFTGYPSGWTLAATYPTPAVNRIVGYSTKLSSDGTAQIGSDLTVGGNTTVGGDLLQVTHGKLLFGTSAVPFLSDYIIQAFKAIANPSGNAAGMIVGFQDGSNSPVNSQLWGIDTGLALYGNCSYNWPVYALQAMARVDVNSHVVGSLSLVSAGATIAGGAVGHETNISTVGSMYGYDFFVNSQGCDPSSNIMNFYGLHDSVAHSLGFNIGNYYGVYLENHSADASNSWGLYNKDRTYMGGMVVRNDGTLQPVHLSNSVTANDSMYFSTDNNALVYKDSSGVVHPLY